MKPLNVLGSLIAAAFLMTGCGGGGGGGSAGNNANPSTSNPGGGTPPGGTPPGGNPLPVDPPSEDPVTAGEPIAGVWLGSMTWNDISHDHPYDWDTTDIVLPNGDFFHVFNHYYHYPTETQRNTMGGFVTGKVKTQGGKLTIGAAREFSFINDFPDRPASISGTYGSGNFLEGRIAYDPPTEHGQDLTRAFRVTPASAYSGPARLSELRFNNESFRSLQGVLWTQRSARADNSFKTPMHLVVNPNGSLGSRFGDQCQVTGQLVPHATQKVYEATLTLGANCPYPGLTFEGVAYLKDSYPTENAPTATPNRFHLVATNNDGGTHRGLLFVQILEGQISDNVPPNP